MRPCRHALLLAALLLASACASAPKARRYLDETMDLGSVKTVAVMPLTNLSRDNLAADRVREVFANMLLATGALYVVPPGEVNRVVARVGVAATATPAVEEVTKLGTALKADAVFVGVLKEYGEDPLGERLVQRDLPQHAAHRDRDRQDCLVGLLDPRRGLGQGQAARRRR